MTTTSAYQLQSPLDSFVHHTSVNKPESKLYTATSGPPNPPVSPLLHGRFARNSTATASSNDDISFLDSVRASPDLRNPYQDTRLKHRYCDDESIYSTITSGSALRDSWQSAATAETVQQKTYSHSYPNETLKGDHSSSQLLSPVPTFVVSQTDSDVSKFSSPGRTPILRPFTNNFSRPVRPSIDATSENEEQKRRVLERNATRRLGPSNSPSGERIRLANSNGSGRSIIERSSSTIVLDKGGASRGMPSQIPSMQPPYLAKLQPVTGFADPQNGNPSRSATPASLYSNYSYYQLPPSAGASPVDEAIPDAPLDPSAFSTQPRAAPKPPTTRAASSSQSPTPIRSPHTVSIALDPTIQPAAQKPQDYLQLGITHHEANRLKESAVCFEKSAKEGGGCGVGMLMWGLTLRHGWGCEKNEKVAFKWLQRAAESAVDDLESARIGGGVDPNAIQVLLTIFYLTTFTHIFLVSQSLSWQFMKLANVSSRGGVFPRIRRWQWFVFSPHSHRTSSSTDLELLHGRCASWRP